MTSNTDSILVFVRLLGEGTVVFRPVQAVPVAQNVVRLMAPADYDPEDEQWEFKPGTLVRIEPRMLGGAETRVAVAAVGF